MLRKWWTFNPEPLEKILRVPLSVSLHGDSLVTPVLSPRRFNVGHSGVTEDIWVPLQSQVWGPQVGFYKGHLATVRLAPLPQCGGCGLRYATDGP
ncbi:hypothetical protein TNCV_4697391 [Trichonephila clavipes]|nr:hypothetical protein TNCV_4697391 [Trichonephila clavipes]